MDTKAYKALSEKYHDTLVNINMSGYYRLSMDEFNEIVRMDEYPIKKSEVRCGGGRNRRLKEIARDYMACQPKKKTAGRPKKIDLDAE